MTRVLVPGLLLVAACGGAGASFAEGSPASPAAPAGHRVPVATVLDAEHPVDAARSPLLAAPTAAPQVDHSHHHHHHHHGAGGAKP